MKAAIAQDIIIQSLRKACQPLHEMLHLHPLLVPLSNADISPNDYAWILRTFQAAYQHMECSRRQQSSDLPDSPVLDWLAQDMAQKNIHSIEIELSKYPVIDSFSKLAGYLYVKQGSSLGGRVIVKHLCRYLGGAAEDYHFFAGYGELTGFYWKQFVSKLEAAEDVIMLDMLVEQAKASFLCIAESCDLMLEHKRL